MAIFNTKLFIFDLDGTLLDTRFDISDAVNFVLKKNGLAVLPEDKIFSFIGNGVAFLLEKCLGRKGMEMYDAVYEDYVVYYSENISKRTVLYDDVIETLDHFADRNMVILSNKPEAMCKKLLSELKLDKYFKEICGGDTFGVLKPEKKGVKALYKKYGVLQEEAIIVGDGPQDINAGKNAGIKVAAVTYGYHSENRLKKENPDLLIDTLSALRNYID
jgi:phosphoglycolate phosphatase